MSGLSAVLFKLVRPGLFHFGLVLSVAGGFDAQGAQVRIEAVLGDKTSSFSVREIGSDRILFHSSNESALKKIKISAKNYDFILEKAEEAIQLSKKDPFLADFSNCPREHALVEVITDVKNVKIGRVCILSRSPASKVLLGLIEVLGLEVL